MSEWSRKQTVLVVDDEPLIRMYAVDVLEDEGIRTLEAGDATQALAMLEAHPEITVLFTDINMPGPLDGLELARRVHERRADVQLILTSGKVRPRQADLPNDGHFLEKPYEAAALTGLIRATG